MSQQDTLTASEQCENTNKEKTASQWYEEGNEYRRQGNFQQAMHCYMEAIELDPQSPARHAKEMMDSIFNFYHHDAYNP